MHVRLGTLDGRIVVSDHHSNEEIQAVIDEQDGCIGTGDFARVRVESPEDAIAMLEHLWAKMLQEKDSTFSIEVNGENVDFPGDQVAWFRFVRD